MIYTFEISEDGDMSIKAMSEKDFERAVNKSPDSFEYSDVDPIDPTQLRDNAMIRDPMYWNRSSGTILAIRGEIVMVKAVTKVHSWEVVPCLR